MIRELIKQRIQKTSTDIWVLLKQELENRAGIKIYIDDGKATRSAIPSDIMALLDKCCAEPSQSGVISTNESITYETQYHDLITYTGNYFKNVCNFVDAAVLSGKINESQAHSVKSFFSDIQTRTGLRRIL